MPDQKEPIPQFAARIKKKYPQYKDMDDTLLTQKIVEKYPQYRDMVEWPVGPVKKKEVSPTGGTIYSAAGEFVTEGGIKGWIPTPEIVQKINQPQTGITKQPVASSTATRKPAIDQRVEQEKVIEKRNNEIGYAQNALEKGQTLEDMAAIFLAQQDENFGRQFQALRETGLTKDESITDILGGKPAEKSYLPADNLFGEATKGKFMQNALSNPQFLEVLKSKPELYNQFKQESANFLGKYPEAGKAYLGNILSDKMEKMGINNGFANIVTKAQLDKVVKQLKEDGEITSQEEIFINEQIRPRMGLENFGRSIVGKPSIKTTGLVENALEGAVQGARNLGQGVAEFTGIRPLIQGQKGALSSDIEREKRQVQVKPVGIWHEITQTGGQIAGQSLSIGGGAKLIGSAGVKSAAAALGMSGGLQAYGNYAPEARKMFPESETKQRGFATVMSLIDAGTEGIFRDDKVLKGLMGELSPSVKRTINDFTSKKISAAAAKQQLGDAFKQAIKKVPEAGKLFSKAVGENMSEEVTAGILQDATQGIFEGKPVEDLVNIENIGNTARMALLGSGPIALIATRADLQKNRGITAKQIYLMARDPETWAAQIRESSTDPADANDIQDKLGNLEYAANLVKELDQNTSLTEKQKTKYLLTSLDNKIKGEQQSPATDPVLRKQAENQIRETMQANDKVKEDILKGEDDGSYEGDNSDNPNSNEAKLFEEIYNKATPVTKATLDEAKKQNNILAGLDYIKDKFAENPIKFREDYGDEITDKVMKQTPTETLIEKMDYMYSLNPDDPSIGAIDQILADRETQTIQDEAELPIQPEETQPESSTDNEPVNPEKESQPDEAITTESGKSKEKDLKFELIEERKKDDYTNNDYRIIKDGKKIGEVMTLNHKAYEGKGTKIVNVYLDEEQRGKGIGKDIYRKINEESIKNTGLAAWSTKGTRNDNSNRLWASLEKSGEAEITSDGDYQFKMPSEKSGEGQPPISEPPKGGGSDLTGITHAQMNEIADEFGLTHYEKDPQTVKGWDAQATERINKDPKAIDNLMNKMRNEGMPSPVEQRMMIQYIASLRSRLRANPNPETLAELNRAKDISNIVGGRFLGQSLVARKGSKPTEDTLDGYLSEWTEAYGTETLPKETIEELAARFDKEQELKLKVDEAYQKGREEAAKEQVAVEVEKVKKDKKQKIEKYQTIRKDAVAGAREALKKLRTGESGLGSTPPLLRELIAIAPHVKNYMKGVVGEGIIKLDAVIDAIHQEFKGLVDGITKGQIRGIIIGQYDEPKKTRNELAELIQNLKTEATLVDKIEKEKLGAKKPTTAEDKIKSSARIEELRKKLNDVRKLKRAEIDDEGVSDVTAAEPQELAKLKKQLLTKIQNLSDKIKTKDYAAQPEAPRRIKLDKEARQLEDQYNKMKEEDLYKQQKAQYDKLSKKTKFFDKVWKILGLKRVIQTAIDFSIPFRQNITTTINPLKWLPRVEEGKLKTPTNVRQFKNMFAFTFVPRLMRDYMQNLRESGEYHDMQSDGIVFSDPHEINLSKREEDFRNNIFQNLRNLRGKDNKVAHLASFIGEPIFASERAAAGALNTIRVERYRAAQRNLEKAGITRENDPEAYKKMAEWVMNMTGRGKMLEMIEGSKTGATLMGNTFYGARLMASRINLIKNPFFSKMPKEVRVEAFKDMAGFVGGVMLTGLALMAAGGAVSFDPDDPDFLQVRFGKRVYDISGGMAAYIRTFLRLTNAAYKQFNPNVSSKEAKKYSNFAGKSLGRFVTNKFSPNTGHAYHFIKGESPGQKEFDPKELLQFYPMYVDDVIDAVSEEGVSGVLSVGIPNILGIGVNTYEPKN